MKTQRSKIAKFMLGFTAIAIAAAVLCLAPSALAQEPFSDDRWSSLGGSRGPNGTVMAAVVDVSGTNLYVGGFFTMAGETKATRIAKWDGNRWTALGSGLNGGVYALVLSGNDLYVAGSFTSAGGVAATNIAKWNGSSWSALGSGLNGNQSSWSLFVSGLNGYVSALAVSGSDLYAAGSFTNAGGVAATNIAKWDGNTWTALASGVNSNVNALAVSGSDLFVGGWFTEAGGVAANHIAKWNGSSWSALGSGLTAENSCTFTRVWALAVSGSDLYAGGAFTMAGGVPAAKIAKWDGSSWSPLGSGATSSHFIDCGSVSTLSVSGNDLYMLGAFDMAGGVVANGLAKWDGSSWSALGAGINGTITTLAVSGADLYAGGYFNLGDPEAHAIAKWNGTTWSPLGPEVELLNNQVKALALSGSNLYLGGYFTKAGGLEANHIVNWNGSNWTALGSGINGNVFALAIAGSNLYAGGDFTNAGGVAANRIAKWNGSSWSTLGLGMNGAVTALAAVGSDLYAGGYFTSAGGVPATNIAKWNGSSWTALGSGLGVSFAAASSVHALAVSGSDLYVGGYFSLAGGIEAYNIAKWNGSSWSALGSGVNTTVRALAVSGGDLYAGGDFFEAGGIAANAIAKWNGSTWSPLGSGLTVDSNFDIRSTVEALAVSGNDLYVGGYFAMAGGAPAYGIAKWNGSSWSALGSGLIGTANALAVSPSGEELYAGGAFTRAGGKAAAFAARAILRLPTLTLKLGTSNTVDISWPSPSTGFTLQQCTDLTSGNWSNISESVLDDGTNNVMVQPVGTSRFFRLLAH